MQVYSIRLDILPNRAKSSGQPPDATRYSGRSTRARIDLSGPQLESHWQPAPGAIAPEQCETRRRGHLPEFRQGWDSATSRGSERLPEGTGAEAAEQRAKQKRQQPVLAP